ncbi:hypothetical protein R3I94_012040 [Phoxinus phoxinus]|uniref:Uncharacterized protein n=1 Tax=Phoxinus phoxinus TaxID=58324 RepID=A0AAN9H7N2_9TELE
MKALSRRRCGAGRVGTWPACEDPVSSLQEGAWCDKGRYKDGCGKAVLSRSWRDDSKQLRLVFLLKACQAV